jgi:hypothetical protein
MGWAMSSNARVIPIQVVKQSLADVALADIRPTALLEQTIAPKLAWRDGLDICPRKSTRSLLRKRHKNLLSLNFLEILGGNGGSALPLDLTVIHASLTEQESGTESADASSVPRKKGWGGKVGVCNATDPQRFRASVTVFPTKVNRHARLVFC